MELKVNLGFDQIIDIVIQLDVEDRKKLLLEIERSLEKKANNKKERKFGLLKGQIWMSDDFDEPLEDFKDYM